MVQALLRRPALVLLVLGAVALASSAAQPPAAAAHQSGCHAAHSCPSDTGSYVCGDTGNSTYCGGGAVTPSTGTSGTSTPVPPIIPTPPRPSDPAGDKDCADFASQAEAQSYFALKGGPVSDSDRLDADNDGIACESGGSGETAPVASTCELRTGTGADPVDTPASPYDVTRADVLFERCISRLTLALSFSAPLPPAPFPPFDYLVWWVGEQSCDVPSGTVVTANVSFLNGATFNVRPDATYPKIYPTISRDRRSLVLSFSSPALVGRDLRCAMASSSRSELATTAYDSVEPFYFAGFEPKAAQRPSPQTTADAPARAATLTRAAARRYTRIALRRRFAGSYRSSASVTCAATSRVEQDCVARWTVRRRARYSGRVTVWTVAESESRGWDYSINMGRRDLRCDRAKSRCLRRIVVR